MFNFLSQLVNSTSNLVRGTVVLLLSGVIVLLAIALAGAIIKGQKLQAWGLVIEAYQSPDVQKCAAATNALQHVNTLNQDSLNLLSAQLINANATADKYTNSAADINNRGGYSSVADGYRDQVKLIQKDVAELHKKQNEIIDSRTKVAEAFQTTCAPR